MNRNVMKFGSLAAICLFSVATMAQAVAVKPRGGVRMNEAVRPGATVVAPRATVKSQSNFNLKTTVAEQTVKAGATCSMETAVAKLTAGNRLNTVEAETALKSGLQVSGCKAGEEGLLSMKDPQAREIAARAVLIKNDRNVSLAEGLAQAKKVVKGIDTTAAAEQANVDMLTSGDCKVFKQAMLK